MKVRIGYKEYSFFYTANTVLLSRLPDEGRLALEI
jgi:hypothetical protein